MSWKASAWAKQQRLGSPAAKSILMCLADYADPNGLINGWASQAQLAEDAEVSERSVRDWMQKLEDMGLMERRRQSRANGARAADVIQLFLSKAVAGEAGESPVDAGDAAESLPANSAGRTYRQPDAALPEAESSPTGTEFRAHKEEPPLSNQYPPEREGARAQEGQEAQPEAPAPDDPRQLERRVKRIAERSRWPGWAGSSTNWTVRQFTDLSAVERDLADDRAAPYLAWCRDQKVQPVSLGVFFRDRKFTEVPMRMLEAVSAAEADKPATAPVFGPAWGAAVYLHLLAGPTAERRIGESPQEVAQGVFDRMRQMVSREAAVRSAARLGCEVGDDDQLIFPDDFARRDQLRWQAEKGFPAVNHLFSRAASHRLGIAGDQAAALLRFAPLMEAVPVGSECFAQWQAEHETRGWPWFPDPGAQPVIFLPKGGPDAGLKALEEALRAERGVSEEGNNGDDDGGQEAAE
ncbi:MAG: hypothetical protein Rhirs2KO_09640 [Rhizobiaceae bacterium]